MVAGNSPRSPKEEKLEPLYVAPVESVYHTGGRANHHHEELDSRENARATCTHQGKPHNWNDSPCEHEVDEDAS